MQSNDKFEVFLHETNEPEYKVIEWKDYRIGYFISKNKNKSSHNEDALFIYGNDDLLVLGVSDGAGGHPKGKEAAYIVGSELLSYYKEAHMDDFSMLDVIERINNKVLDLKVGARSTLVLTAIHENDLRSFSVGDSEIIHWNGQGTEQYSNIPQSEVGYRIEAGVLPQEKSLDHPERYSVDNLIGDNIIRIEVTSKITTKKGHSILLGSDGLFDNLSHEQLSEIAGKGSFGKSFEDLCDLCLRQEENSWKKDDDIAFILIRKIKA